MSSGPARCSPRSATSRTEGVHGTAEVKGLAPGDMIVSRGQARLVKGQLVVPRNPDGTLAGQPMPDVAEAPESQR